MLSLFAAALYALVVAASVAAYRVADTHRQQAWHSRAWAVIAAFFLLLIVARLLSLEDIVRDQLRAWLSAENIRAGRRAFQGPIIAVALGVFALIAFGGAYWVANRISGRRNIAVVLALASVGAMIVLIALRIISLHAMDFLLFGPPKLNWVGDLGLTILCGGAAFYYAVRVREAKKARRR